MAKSKKIKPSVETTVEPKTPKQLLFKIGDVEYSDKKEIRNVYLDGKIIYVVDCTKLAGLVMRDQTKDVIDAISKTIGRTINAEEFRRIKLLGFIEV